MQSGFHTKRFLHTHFQLIQRIKPKEFSWFLASGKCLCYIDVKRLIVFWIYVNIFVCSFLVTKHSLHGEKHWKKSKIAYIRKPLNIVLLKWKLHPSVFLKQVCNIWDGNWINLFTRSNKKYFTSYSLDIYWKAYEYICNKSACQENTTARMFCCHDQW